MWHLASLLHQSMIRRSTKYVSNWISPTYQKIFGCWVKILLSCVPRVVRQLWYWRLYPAAAHLVATFSRFWPLPLVGHRQDIASARIIWSWSRHRTLSSTQYLSGKAAKKIILSVILKGNSTVTVMVKLRQYFQEWNGPVNSGCRQTQNWPWVNG